ncbi:MAG: hypothetical protein R2706_09120 [Acidimicrobiales bacterium]
MEERQFDCVDDLFDLLTKSADVVVAYVGDLLEDQIVDVDLGQLLDKHR